MTKTLDGIRVLDLTRLLPGAVMTMLLADMGADIIKIEDPNAGDYARQPPPLVDGMGVFFRASNRDKRSVIINLKHEAGQAAFQRMAQAADVVVEGFRPSVTARLGVDYDTLKAINPRIVYCSLSGWGQTGTNSALSGHDVNYLAQTGVLGSMGNPQLLGGQLADVGGAYVGVMGVLGALFKRERTGAGDYIDVALSESAMPFAFYQMVESLVMGMTGGSGTLTGFMAFYNVYHSADGQAVALAAIEPKFWANFCNAVEKPEWIAIHTDLPKQESLKEDLRALFATRTAQAWHDLLADADCCFSVVIPPNAAADDVHIQDRGMLHIQANGVPLMRSPVRLQAEPIDLTSAGDAPQHGEHTDGILGEFGFSADEIADLHQSGAIDKA